MNKHLIRLIIKGISILAILMACVYAEAKTLKVAVIDSGITDYQKTNLKLCESGHKDFTGEGLNDTDGHGSHVAGLIAKYAGDADYCFIIYKIFGKKNKMGYIRNALAQALQENVDIINISGGGPTYDLFEMVNVTTLLNKGVIIVVAAGNNYHNLSQDCNYYPACYDSRITVVGNKLEDGNIESHSNFDLISIIIDHWEIGRDTIKIDKDKYLFANGTSQATAIRTGKIINETSFKAQALEELRERWRRLQYQN